MHRFERKYFRKKIKEKILNKKRGTNKNESRREKIIFKASSFFEEIFLGNFNFIGGLLVVALIIGLAYVYEFFFIWTLVPFLAGWVLIGIYAAVGSLVKFFDIDNRSGTYKGFLFIWFIGLIPTLLLYLYTDFFS